MEGEDIIGEVRIFAWYDDTLYYEGELPGKISLSLSARENYPIYEGKTGTVNAFSFLD
jgi:hypothetical protein